jgi:hypothetical protein
VVNLWGEREGGDAYPKKEQQREYDGCVRGEWWWVAWVEELESLLATGYWIVPLLPLDIATTIDRNVQLVALSSTYMPI